MEGERLQETAAALVREHVAYDPDTGLLHVINAWAKKKVGDILGYPTGHGYLCTQMFGHRLYVHQWAMFFMHDVIPPYVDHRNGIGTDNRYVNLRAATQSQNMANGPSRVGKYRGVFLHSQGHKWCAAITKDYRTQYLGIYDTEEEAALAYNNAAAKTFGEFARLNKLPLPK